MPQYIPWSLIRMTNVLAHSSPQQGLHQLRGLCINPFSKVQWEVEMLVKYGFTSPRPNIP